MVMQHMLTTVDNPFDPFDEFDKWDSWDRRSGYCSSAFLARVVNTSDELSEADVMSAIERGIDEIVLRDETDMFRKVSKDVDIETQWSKLVDTSSG